MERYLPDDIVQHIVYWKEVNEAKIEFDNVWQRLTQAWTDYWTDWTCADWNY